MNNLILPQSDKLTMSSREIADLTGKQHSKVMSVIIDLSEKGIAKSATPCKSLNAQNGQYYDEFTLNKRDSLVLVARLSPEFTASIIDRWQELETKLTPQIPTNFAEALQLAADQAKQLELAAPKIAFVENLVERSTLMTSTQVAQKHKMSAVKLNRFLDELGGVYSKGVKRSRVFIQAFIDKGYGEVKQTVEGHSQPLFTPLGEVWINEKLINEGVI